LLAQGRTVDCGERDEEGMVAGVCDGELMAIGEMAEGTFQPRRVFVAS
ncbi:MAG: hypothetical protein HKN71_08135, partial [Gemmatimonadetes bacterium]|nr:hypothetical protein [Gemmatimonadota bacterium]